MSSGSHDRFTLFSGGILTALGVMCLVIVFMLGDPLPPEEHVGVRPSKTAAYELVELPPDIVKPANHYQSEKMVGKMNPFFTDYFVPKTDPKPKPKPPPETIQVPVIFQGLVKLADGGTIVYLMVDGSLLTTAPGETVRPGWKLAEASASSITFDGGEGRTTRIGFRETGQLEIPRPQK